MVLNEGHCCQAPSQQESWVPDLYFLPGEAEAQASLKHKE